MGNTIASCGHKLSRKESKGVDAVMVRALASDGTRAVRHLVLCPACLRLARSKGVLITSDPERDRWLAGLGGGEVW